MTSSINRDLFEEASKERRDRRALWLLMIAAAFAFGVLVGIASPGTSPLEREVSAAEAECAKEKRELYAVYVVSRWAAIRGCLLVPEVTAIGAPRVIFVRKEQP